MQQLPLSDAAIASATQDRLCRRDFALHLLSLVTRAPTDRSLVISVSGGWGEGKTSIKNMMLEALEREPKDRRPVVIEFAPWHWNNQKEITAAFFREIRLAIGRASPWWKRLWIVRGWRKYARRIQGAPRLVDEATTKVAVIVAAASSLGLSLSATKWPVAQWLQNNASWIGGGLALLAATLGIFGKVFDSLAAASDIEGRTVEEMRTALTKQTAQLEHSVLVIIDDLDRATFADIRSTISHVKASLSFPRLIFLLLYDHKIIERALDKFSGNNGRKYLEKLVQIPLLLPQIENYRVRNIVFGGLNQILSHHAPTSDGAEGQRWISVFEKGISPFIQNLRDAHRFLATLAVTVELLKVEDVLEVNVIDLIGLHALGVFEPTLFSNLPANRDLLLFSPAHASSSTGEGMAMNRLIDLAEPARIESVGHLLADLFPTAAHINRISSQNIPHDEDWESEFRVCTGEFFDRYFLFAVPEHQVSSRELGRLLSTLPNLGVFKEELDALVKKDIDSTFTQLRISAPQITSQNLPVFLAAMFDLSDRINASGPFGFDITDFGRLENTCVQILRAQMKTPDRAALFMEAIKLSTGVAMVAHILLGEVESRSKNNWTPDQMMLSQEELKAASQLWISKVRAAFSGRTLQNLPQAHFSMIWRAWSKLDETDWPARWLADVMSTDKGLMQLLLTIVDKRGPFARRKPTSEYFFDLTKMPDWIDTEVIARRVRQMSTSNWSEDETVAAESFLKAAGSKPS